MEYCFFVRESFKSMPSMIGALKQVYSVFITK